MFSIAPAAAVSSWLAPLWCRAPRVSRDCVSGPGIDLHRRRTRTCTRSLGEGTNTECLWVVQRRVYIGGSPCATATHAFLFTCFRLCIVYLPSSSVFLSSLWLSLFLSHSSPTPPPWPPLRKSAAVVRLSCLCLISLRYIVILIYSYCIYRPLSCPVYAHTKTVAKGLGRSGKSTARGRCPPRRDFRCRVRHSLLSHSLIHRSSAFKLGQCKLKRNCETSPIDDVCLCAYSVFLYCVIYADARPVIVDRSAVLLGTRTGLARTVWFLSADIPRTGPINNVTTVIIVSPRRPTVILCMCLCARVCARARL